MPGVLTSALLAAVLSSRLEAGADVHGIVRQEAAPRILLDQSPRAVEYQLSRLTNDELSRVERQPTDVKYRPIYYALLTRKGLARALRDEALAALTKLDNASQSQVLLQALAKLPADQAEDPQTGDQLLDILLGQPADVLRGQRDIFVKAAADGQPMVLRGAYGAMMAADGEPGPAWQAALKDGHLVELLRSVPRLGKADDLRVKLFTPIAALLNETPDAATRAAAVAALGWTRRDSATFELLAREIVDPSRGADAATRAAAVTSLQLIPEAAWPKAALDPLARAIVGMIKETTPEHRTDPEVIEAVQLGEKLAAALPDESKRLVRRDLRALGVRVITIDTVPEQLMYDLKWFVVEAGKPVQIVLSNSDTMPHNIVVGQPGSVQEIGAAGAAVAPTSDPNAKAYVPESPLVLASTRLLNGGETERLNFTAPAKPGEYVYLCTFPGHWIRMYGVMLVVENLEAWEAKPTEPTDPLTSKPIGPQKAVK
jgi:azurin/DNA-binding transcriptional ArsR family regulator